MILDVSLGSGIGGFETARRIRLLDKGRFVPIVFMSGYRQDELSLREGYGTGAVDNLSKPTSPLLLRSKVKVFADLHRLRRSRKSSPGRSPGCRRNASAPWRRPIA